jgi:hypothetical protein
MKNLFTRLFGLMLLFGIACTALNAAVKPENINIPNPKVQDVKNNKNQIQEDKKIVFFNNLVDPSKQQDNFYFQNGYWRYVDGSYGGQLFKDDIQQMDFSDQNIAALKIMDHECYVFPMGDFVLYANSGNKTVINFIKAVLDSGKRVVLFGHNMLTSSKNNPLAKAFVEDTMGIKDIEIHPVSTKSGSTTTIYNYSAFGKDYDPIGLNTFKLMNARGTDIYGQAASALINYLDVEVFKTKNDSIYETFDFLGSTVDRETAVRTDQCFGIRKIFKNKARVVLFSYGLENMLFTYDAQQVLVAAIRWSMMNNVDADGPLLDITSGDFISFGNVNIGSSKNKNILLLNNGNQTLKIDKIWFEDENKDVFYPVDDKGVNIESSLITQKINIEPGKGTSIKITFKPKVDQFPYIRTMYIKTNEQKLDGSGIGREYGITCFGEGGDIRPLGPYVAFNYEALDFEEVTLGDDPKILPLEVYNKGLTKLDIASIMFKDNSEGNFFIPADDLKKKTIDPESSETYHVTFYPKNAAAKMTAWLKFYVAEAENGTEFSIPCYGAAKEKEIEPYVSEIFMPGGNFRLEVSPNPAGESAIATYTWDKGTPSDLDMWLIDLNGNKVMSLLNTRIDNGSGSVNINTTDLSSGTYFILAKIRGKAAKIPLVILK